jgi:hypothetical protein
MQIGASTPMYDFIKLVNRRTRHLVGVVYF